ncbi:hypothetical protein LINPERHAP1_LOCUS30009 [Linum perenne]
MEQQVAMLSIRDEEEEIVFDDIPDAQPLDDYKLYVVGVLLTDRGFNFHAFQDRMSNMWRPGRGVAIEDIGDKVIIFRFGHEVDLRRVVESGPYSFDQNLLILHELKPGENPKEVDLHFVEFWVQVHNLTVGFFSETVGKALKDFVGQFVEYD